ncbi:MAG TPA: hypothetical protein VF288_04715 [Mycobacteriales bacterium]
MSGQLSFFSAAARIPDADDLAGLLCGPAQVVQRDDRARVSVVLAEDWRVAALAAELALRALDAEVVVADETDGWSGPRGGARSVRTPFLASLVPLADRWTAGGAGKRVPPRLVLDGPMLRLWYVVAGRRWDAGHALGLGEHDEAVWPAVGALLAASGLPAAFVGPRGDGPAYRLTGRRRLTRLAELVGDPPADAPDGAWPI